MRALTSVCLVAHHLFVHYHFQLHLQTQCLGETPKKTRKGHPYNRNKVMANNRNIFLRTNEAISLSFERIPQPDVSVDMMKNDILFKRTVTIIQSFRVLCCLHSVLFLTKLCIVVVSTAECTRWNCVITLLTTRPDV